MIFYTVISGVIAILGYTYYKYPWIKWDIEYFAALISFGAKGKRILSAKKWVIDIFESKVEQNPSKTFLIFQDKSYTYNEINKRANKVANFATSKGWKKGDVVAVVIHNEPEFIWTYFGLSKCGIVSSFINTNLRANSLQHCLSVCSPKAIIVGKSHDLQKAVAEVRNDIDFSGEVYFQGSKSDDAPGDWISMDSTLETTLDKQPEKGVRQTMTSRSPICYIYTSGTTGLPKPAIVAQDRALKGAMIPGLLGMKKDDILYTGLPLYHSAAGLMALGTTVYLGATLVLREKFSASKFWEDCKKHNVTTIQYIGELCRFLLSRPKSELDKDHKVRLAFGNGLRADIWPEFREKFGIKKIADFYAATEGNVGFVNIHNKEGSVGRCSPLLRTLFPIKFLEYDFDTAQPVRNAQGFCTEVKDGFCSEVKDGKPGLFVAGIKRDLEFDGYKGSKEMTEKKILHDVFKTGDAYFNSGDLLYTDKDYFVYFSDRLGDTFRWKGENVSTTEVANALTGVKWIEDANVYGVSIPGTDGKCGMASLTLTEGRTLTANDLSDLYQHCGKSLAQYAFPRFLRIQAQMTLTSTFKQQKTTLVKEGFDPAAVGRDSLYYMDAKDKTYTELDSTVYEAIKQGEIRL